MTAPRDAASRVVVSRGSVAVSRIDKARGRLRLTLAAMGLTGYRADRICECADHLAAERVRETTIAVLANLEPPAIDPPPPDLA